jgi:hypothetical protein
MDNDHRKSIGCCCCCSSIVAIIILIFFSFSSLAINEQGLDYAKISKTVGKKIYGPGYHYLGFAHSFITYPSTVLNMEFSTAASAERPPINSRTDDGLAIKFKISFQYTLLPNKLFEMYMTYGTNYKPPCEKFAVDTLNDAATKHDATTFFEKPDIVRAAMTKRLNITLIEKCFASLTSLQLSGVDLPDLFNSAIILT